MTKCFLSRLDSNLFLSMEDLWIQMELQCMDQLQPATVILLKISIISKMLGREKLRQSHS